MITVTLQFNSIEQAEAALRLFREPAPVTAPTTTAPPAPTNTPTPPPAPPTTAPTPPVDSLTPDELAEIMQTASDKLKDKGAACMKIIKDLGVKGVADMTALQRITAKTRVEAL